MEIEEVEVPNSPYKGNDSPNSSPSNTSPTKTSAPSLAPEKKNDATASHAGPSKPEVNGDDGKEHLEAAPSPTNKSSPLSGITAPKIPNIKIRKQYSKIYRIKTKILQNLGKADKTTDEVFDDYEANFNKQQLNANRLHKEITNYLRCARALHGASKALFETLAEVYEPEWVGHDLIYVQAQNSDMLWTDFCHKLQDQTLAPLTTYTQEFPEIRKKIDKRGRKLVDYDSQRHQLENLQRSTRRDEYKIARVKDQLEGARSTYESLNKELYDELPAIFDERIPNTANSLQTLFAAEATFMQESSKISVELEAIAEKLSKECSKGIYNIKRGTPPKAPKLISSPLQHSPTSPHSRSEWYEVEPAEGDAHGSSQRSPQLNMEGSNPSLSSPEKRGYDMSKTKMGLEEVVCVEEGNADLKEEEREFFLTTTKREDDKGEDASSPLFPSDSPPRTPPPTLPLSPPPDSPPSTAKLPSQQPRKSKDENRPIISSPVTPGKEETGRPYEEIEFEDKKVNGSPKINGDIIGTSIPPGNKTKLEELYDIPVGATTEGLPSGVLYRVRATYKYVREDVDELGFEVGETIQVVEYDDPEEQEEGWLCGIKESTNEKGLFPANFTRPI